MPNNFTEQILNEIEINENHINSFPLETKTGTKRLKEKFHKNAVIERNAYIEKEIPKFKEYQKQIYQQLDGYVQKTLPQDKSEEYNQERNKLTNILEIIPYVNDKISLELKLGFADIFYKLSDEAESSLNTINHCILDFLNKMTAAGISLTVENFNYSPFTISYMSAFFQYEKAENFDDLMQERFKEIYWECPEIIMHLKRNLIILVRKNEEKLKLWETKICKEKLNTYQLEETNIETTYKNQFRSLEDRVETDEFFNLQKFLNKVKNIDDYIEGAPLRNKSFNQLTTKETYQSLTEEEQKDFDEETVTLNRELKTLKDYYRYESIIKDMITRYKKKDESKVKYSEKQKEIASLEKDREKLYKAYNKAMGIGLFAKKSPEKASQIKVKIKEQINKLETMYQELEDLEIDFKIAENLNEGSSIYDAFIISLSSYSYMQKVMIEKFKDIDTSFDLNKYMKEYISFIYNPNTDFLHKVTVLLDYDISEIISEKYALLGISVDKEEISKDTIDTEIEIVNNVSLVNNIKKSAISIDEIKLICDIKKLDYKIEEEIL